jgi:3-hydroxymyristoyl/3-hydroxydecanoyl-(acyl carrier protein) dehydratase
MKGKEQGYPELSEGYFHCYVALGVQKCRFNSLIQGDQKVSVHLMITVQKTSKNVLNSFNHLPW